MSYRPHTPAGLWHTNDGRGQPRPVNLLSPRAWGSLPRDAQLPLAGLFAGLLIIVAVCIGFTVERRHTDIRISIAFIIFFLSIMIVTTGWIFSWGRGFPERAAARLVKCGRCPTCLYDLTALTPEHDGCTVCPECSGAWRRPADTTTSRNSDAI